MLENIVSMFKTPEQTKLIKSLYISAGAVLIIFIMRYLFPESDWTTLQTAVLTAISAWVINTVRESLK